MKITKKGDTGDIDGKHDLIYKNCYFHPTLVKVNRKWHK